MLLRKKVKAGVLLYSLLMASIFTLVLQVYLFRVVEIHRIHQENCYANQAYLMANLVVKNAREGSGQMVFNTGVANYQVNESKVAIDISLAKNHREFHYNLPLKKEKIQQGEDKKDQPNDGHVSEKNQASE